MKLKYILLHTKHFGWHFVLVRTITVGGNKFSLSMHFICHRIKKMYIRWFMWLLIHLYFGRVKQFMCCNILEVASLRISSDTAVHQLFRMNCKLSEDEHLLCKNLQHFSPRPAYLIALKAFPQGSHHKESWDNSAVNLCGDWAKSNVMAPSTVRRADEITNASEIFFICARTNPLNFQQVENEAPICQIRDIAGISGQKLGLSVYVSHANCFAYIRLKWGIY